MKGSVYKRCPCPVERDARGGRKACRIDHGSWEYVADVGRGRDGKRRQQRKAGFPTRKAAEDALTELLDDLRTASTRTTSGRRWASSSPGGSTPR